jgi:serine/threonine-protein kinase
VEAVALLRQVCSALGAAHARGIIHRDIKPSNLFLTNAGGKPVLKVLDFGIARAVLEDENTAVTKSGAIFGSPVFMSPEQANGDPVGPSSDLWSLASVAYRMLTGEEPFAGRNVADTLNRIRAGKFVDPSERVPDLPKALDGFFAKAFASDPLDRYQSAEEFCQAFTEASECQPDDDDVVFGRDHTTRDITLPRRNGRHIAAVVGIALLLALGIGVMSRNKVPPKVNAASPSQPPPRAALEDPAAKQVAVPSPTEPPPVPSAAPAAPTTAPPAPKPGRRPASAARQPPLTEQPALGTPRSSGASTDPLFGLPVPDRGGASDAERSSAQRQR